MAKLKIERLESIDALRGFDMFFVFGGSALFAAVFGLFGLDRGDWLVQQTFHGVWDGFCHRDTIFPLFLFIAGTTCPFSLSAKRARGVSTCKIVLSTVRRAVSLVVLGLIVNGLFGLDFAHLRLVSVLGRIGVAWMLAVWLYLLFGVRMRVVVALLILTGYWALQQFVGAPDCPDAGHFSQEGNIVCWFDRTFHAGRNYRPLYDPEGFLGTIPSVVTVMIGVFAGEFLHWRPPHLSETAKCFAMAATGAVLLTLGFVFSDCCPINKPLWSSTFVLASGGYSLVMLALFHWFVDVRAWHRLAFPFKVIGVNAIVVFMLQPIVPFSRVAGFFTGGLQNLVGPPGNALIANAGIVAVNWLILYMLYRQRIFLKV